MKEFINKVCRKSGTILDSIPLTTIITFYLILAGQLLGMKFMSYGFVKNIFNSITKDDNVTLFISDYASFIGIWFLILIVVAIFKRNRPMFKAITYNHNGNNLKGLLIGLLLGFVTNGFCVLVSVLTNKIHLSFNGIDPLLIIMFFVAVFIQSSGEELTSRMYMYQKLRRRYKNPKVAIIMNMFLFMLLHTLNPGFSALAAVQLCLVAIIFSLIVYYYDSLWAAMAFHAMWNYTQNIIFGLPNSGIVSAYSIFKLEAASATNGLFYNVNFGVEGSIGSSLVLLVVLGVILYLNWGKKEKVDLWADLEREEELKLQEKELHNETTSN